MRIVLLGEDLRSLLARAENNPVCHSSNIPPGSAKGILFCGRDFSRPEAQDIVSLGAVLNIGLYRTVALILKKEWEKLLCREMGCSSGQDLMEIDQGEIDVQVLKNKFNPDTELIFDTIEQHGGLVSKTGYDQRTLNTLIQEMIAADLHLVENDSRELETFAERADKALELLTNSTKEEKQAFWISKSCWLQRQDELGERLLLLERRRLENANITWKWMALFGSAYVELQEQANRFDRLQLRIELYEADPDLTPEALNDLVAEKENKMHQRLEVLRMELSLAAHSGQSGSGGSVNSAELCKYRQESKRILREIWLLIHPDKLLHHPAYGDLTEKQKELLRSLWHRIMEIRSDELGFEEGQIGYRYRSIPVLLDVLLTAKALLTNTGIDTDVHLIVKGKTLGEQLEWLEKAIERLDREIENVQAELKALLEDPDMRDRLALMRCPLEQQQKIRSEMLEDAREYQEKGDALEARLTSVFDNRGLS